jgi:glutaminyl-peptide cyclotransferase
MIKLLLNMRTLTSVVLLFCLSSIILINCAQSSKPSRKPVTSIQIQNGNKNHAIGDKINIELKTKIKDGSLAKVDLFLDEKSIYTAKNIDASYTIETANLSVGTHVLKVISTKEDGQSGEYFNSFMLLSDVTPVKYVYKVVKSFPHAPHHFTQGLEIYDGYLYEGTGREGQSGIYKTDLKTWKVIKEHKLEDQYFGEGITILNGKLYELTYKTKIGFTYDVNTFQPLKSWTFKSAEGWGFTNDGNLLIMSDGTEYLTFLDPQTMSIVKKIQVCNNKGVVTNLNELEYIKGEIWANIWMTDNIVRIDPKTGKIVGEIDLKGLLGNGQNDRNGEEDVLNGIAFDTLKNKIYVTGKLWSKIFEIEVVRK